MTTRTNADTHTEPPAYTRPEFVRLPKPGRQCPYTGLSRSAVNALILATEANGHKPPVKSFVLRKRGAKTGIRLIGFDSLVGYIRTQQQESAIVSETQEAA